MLLQNRHLTGVSFRDPYLNIEWTLKDSNILVRGTPGAGDFMFTMSSALYVANLLDTKLNVIFYWDHDADYQHHFEDPESIFEKIDYFHSLCYRNELVTYEHIYNFDVKNMFDGRMMLNLERDSKGHGKYIPKGLCSWKFKPHLYRKPFENKVAVWRFKFNAEVPNRWKTMYTNEHWEEVVNSVREQGYDVVELCYRTPIREAFYHIQTARFCMGYDGMWHYLARMLYKPTLITGDNTIVNMHNPQAMPFYEPKKDAGRKQTFMQFASNMKRNINRLDANCKRYVDQVDDIIENR